MKKLINVFFATVTFGSLSYGQIGINTETPDSSSAMDIQSPSGSNRGILLPRMTTSEMNAISSPAQGLMIFNNTDKLFYYFDGSQWVGLVPKQMNTGYSNDPILNGNLIVDSGSVVSPNMSTQNLYSSKATIDTLVSLNVPGYSVNALVPTGAIIMWSGSVVPPGWGLCNGHFYAAGGLDFATYPPFIIPNLLESPDLRGRFIVGHDPSKPIFPAVASNNGTDINYGAIGNTGGENGHLLTSGESGLPAHIHPSTSHHHDVLDVAQNTNDVDSGNDSSPIAAANETNVNFSTTSATVTTPLSTAQDASVVHENRPPYYVLAYIIKLP